MARDHLDEAIWGPPPSRWRVFRARVWNRYWLLRLRLRRHTVCRIKGHSPKFAQPDDFYWHGLWFCSRCSTHLGEP